MNRQKENAKLAGHLGIIPLGVAWDIYRGKQVAPTAPRPAQTGAHWSKPSPSISRILDQKLGATHE